MKDVDEGFYKRADAHIFLANEQITPEVARGKVSASSMFAVARFNAWISACGFDNAEDLQNSKEKMIEYFVKEYRQMLEENLDDYIANFDAHLGTSKNGQ
ncbi:MAG: DUF3144 domain-containing protein [Motiliproteus sp.]